MLSPFCCCHLVPTLMTFSLGILDISTLMDPLSISLGFYSHLRMWSLWLIVSTIPLVLCHFKNIKVFYTSSKYQKNFLKTISTLFSIPNSLIKPFSSLLVYTNFYLTRMRNLIKRLSKTSGMKRLRLLRRLILGLVRLNLLWQFCSGDLQFVRKYLS